MQTAKKLKSKSKSIFWTVVAFLLFSPVGVIFARDTGGNPKPQLQNPLRSDINSIETFLKMLLKAVVTISTPIIILMIVYSGFLFIKAQGNPEELKTAKKAIMWTIIGAIIVLGAAVLSEAIKGTVDDIQYGGVSEYERTQTLKNYGLPTGTEGFDPSRPESVFNPKP